MSTSTFLFIVVIISTLTHNAECWNDWIMGKLIDTIDPNRIEIAHMLGLTNAWGSRAIIFFEHGNYGGDSRLFTAGDVSRLEGGWNDIISSVVVFPDCRVTVWEHWDYNGNSKTFYSSATWIGDDWNDKISSLSVRCDS
jgi:hypothetical protein